MILFYFIFLELISHQNRVSRHFFIFSFFYSYECIQSDAFLQSVAFHNQFSVAFLHQLQNENFEISVANKSCLRFQERTRMLTRNQKMTAYDAGFSL